MTSTATVKSRGTKRKCQDAECARPFYDLNRTEFACPICGTGFDLKVAEQALLSLHGRPSDRRSGRSFPIVAPAPYAAAVPVEAADLEDAEEVVAEDAGPEIEADDTILEEVDDPDALAAVVEPAPKDARDE